MVLDRLQPMAASGGVQPSDYALVRDFLFAEAELLDNNLFETWFELIDERIRYVIPIRVTRMRGEGSELSVASHIDDGYSALRSRVLRMASPANWAENPPSRTRHHISNVRVGGGQSEGNEERIQVRSNVLFFRMRIDDPHYDLISCERQDILVHKDGSFRLLERYVILDHTTVNTHNIAFLL